MRLSLLDQAFVWGGTVAEYLDLPFVTICSAVVLNEDLSVPPFNTLWQYSPTWWGRLRNRMGYQLINRLARLITEAIAIKVNDRLSSEKSSVVSLS